MESYQRAMKEAQLNLESSTNWSLPQLYFNADSNIFHSGDSLVWRRFEYPNSNYLLGDSLYEFYFHNWEEQFPDMKELNVLFDKENKLMLMEEKLIEFQELYEYMPAEPQFLAFEPVHMLHRSDFGVSDRARRIVTDELHEDDLIEYGREYMVLIDKKQMLINGEKQPRSVFKKYRRLVDSMDDPWKLDDDEEFRMHIER
jgi:hypothetical protein